MKEQLLAIDDFDMPKNIEGIETDIVLLIRLIMLEPGTFQSHPSMGVGLVNKWRYSDSNDLSDLEDEIYRQISKYLPHLMATSVSVKYQSRYIIINIATESYTLVLRTNEDVDTLYIKDILA